jgi:SNF2 family DNA or RNA helicase
LPYQRDGMLHLAFGERALLADEMGLSDLLEDPTAKVIVFSEWERMLELVRQLVREMGVEAAWHTGSVPQQRRRAEINRFKNDPACRLFLSTDSGSVGLNLQVASAVVNVDLPWNPAKLEQRIARLAQGPGARDVGRQPGVRGFHRASSTASIAMAP